MFFGNSKILWLLFALSIPIIIHLVKLTKLRKVEFSSFKFLKTTLQQGLKPKKLMRFIILLSRILAFMCIILAFSIPSCNKLDKNMPLLVGVCLDNSLSMGPKQNDPLYFEKQKNGLKEIIKNLPSNTLFKLISYSNFGGVSNPLNAEEAINWVNETKISFQSSVLQDLILRLKQSTISETGMQHAYYIVSDCKKGSVVTENTKEIKLEKATILLAETIENTNLSIDSAWINTEVVLVGESIEIGFKVTNWSSTDIKNLPIKLMDNSTQLGLVAVDCKANESVYSKFEIRFNTNWKELKINLSDEYNKFDNELFLNLGIQAKIGIKKMGSTSIFVNNVLKTQPIFTESTPINAVICEECSEAEVLKLTTNKPSYNSIVLTLGLANTTQSMANFLGVNDFKFTKGEFSITSKSLQNPMFANVFSKYSENIQMPIINSYFSTAGNSGFMEPILTLQNGDIFYGKLIKNKVQILVCTAPFNLNYSNWVKSFLFLPTLTKSVLPSLNNKQLYVSLNTENGYFLKTETDAEILDKGLYSISGNGVNQIASIAKGISGSELQNIQMLPKAGIYAILDNNKKEIERFAVNINPLESNINTEPKLKTIFPNSSIINAAKGYTQAKAAIKNNITESTLWKVFIWFGIIFFILEMILVIINRKLAKQNIK